MILPKLNTHSEIIVTVIKNPINDINITALRVLSVNLNLGNTLIPTTIGNSIIIHQNQSDPERLVIIQRRTSMRLSMIERFIYYELRV